MSNNNFFTNTYITGSGRHNYLRIDHLEDPLFTSFTFDIDFASSPLFYTINYSDYGYPNITGLADRIETALMEMYAQNMSGQDLGYDILPSLSAHFIDGIKLGFGLQQNVYMDTPLYGATEYIYMVDKRNGRENQNDVRYDSGSGYVDGGGIANASNSYKLGDSVKEVVNDSDREWATRRYEEAKAQIDMCDEILTSDPETEGTAAHTHSTNETNMKTSKDEYDFANVTTVEGFDKPFTEDSLADQIKVLKEKVDKFNALKKEIVVWANENISKFQNESTRLYSGNSPMKKISTYADLGICDDAKKKTYYEELKKLFGATFVYDKILGDDNSFILGFKKAYNGLITHSSKEKEHTNSLVDDKKSFLINMKKGDGRAAIRPSLVIDKFKDKLSEYDLMSEDGKSFVGDIQAIQSKSSPDWITNLRSGFADFAKFCISSAKSNDGYKGPGNEDSICADWTGMANELMTYQCDEESSFVKFESKIVTENNNLLGKCEAALSNLRSSLYGTNKDGTPRDKTNAHPDSTYGKYLSAKDTYENDDYSTAQKMKDVAESGFNELASMVDIGDSDNDDSNIGNNTSSNSGNDPIVTDAAPVESNSSVGFAPRTVLDMLGFIFGMKKMITQYPYIIQSITGLDAAYNKHYGIKDPYLGSGDDKITLTCWESLDLRVSSMFNRYFNAVYDRQYRRERVPVNLRRFNCSIYVHDIRNFNSRYGIGDGKIQELTDMYFSVIEFRFYDCEIVPEETGNIFNDISNEAPSEMKKTNFSFTYGNCVVNYVPRT